MVAVRGTPVIDGRIDDAAWHMAPWSDVFVQRIPQTGARAAHRTRARVLYDEWGLYVAIACETATRPAARLSHRDEIPNGEWVRVMIDARG